MHVDYQPNRPPSLQNCWTPLLAGTWYGHTKVVHILVNHGADIRIPNEVSRKLFCY